MYKPFVAAPLFFFRATDTDAKSSFHQLRVCALDNIMFRLIGRLRLASVNRGARLPPKRQFSVKAVYSSFPATLTYYRPKQLSSLFDHAENDSRPDDPYDEGVVIASDGLVYPGVNKTSGAWVGGCRFLFKPMQAKQLTIPN